MHTPGSANTANTSAITTTHADAAIPPMSCKKNLQNTTQCRPVESVCTTVLGLALLYMVRHVVQILVEYLQI